MTIEFDDTLITKNEVIDSQHKELIERIKKFVDSCEKKDSKIDAVKMMDYLIEYTDFLFTAEEKLQEEVGYPELPNHKTKHDEFRKTLSDLENFLEESEGPTEEFVEQVKKKVVDWLFNHIKTFDRSVAEYIFINENPDRL